MSTALKKINIVALPNLYFNKLMGQINRNRSAQKKKYKQLAVATRKKFLSDMRKTLQYGQRSRRRM